MEYTPDSEYWQLSNFHLSLESVIQDCKRRGAPKEVIENLTKRLSKIEKKFKRHEHLLETRARALESRRVKNMSTQEKTFLTYFSKEMHT